MNKVLEYRTNVASASMIAAHLLKCDQDFNPQLSKRVVIADYGIKLVAKAERFEAWNDGELVGLVATYCTDASKGSAFISTVSVDPLWRGQGLASRLLDDCIAQVRGLGFACVKLEVGELNQNAARVYRHFGFVVVEAMSGTCCMCLNLGRRES